MKIGVIDYGASNIFSVVRALNSLGASTKILKKSKDFENIDKLVFPGQGSMGACLKKLSENDLRDALIFSLKNLPFLGICLGLQILFSESEESEDEKGLGIFPEKIKKFSEFKDMTIKIPHMGWNEIISQKHVLFNDILQGTDFYFVHSYYFKTKTADHCIATTSYPNSITAAVCKENIFGTQFHPEKSHKNGKKIIDNFLKWETV
mgnify:CR=1 FL=1